jgi:hypothetical protein
MLEQSGVMRRSMQLAPFCRLYHKKKKEDKKSLSSLSFHSFFFHWEPVAKELFFCLCIFYYVKHDYCIVANSCSYYFPIGCFLRMIDVHLLAKCGRVLEILFRFFHSPIVKEDGSHTSCTYRTGYFSGFARNCSWWISPSWHHCFERAAGLREGKNCSRCATMVVSIFYCFGESLCQC